MDIIKCMGRMVGSIGNPAFERSTGDGFYLVETLS
jgi:hypothetical protein